MLITETSRKIKARQSLYGKRNAVKQFVIMTPENPMGLSVTAEENAKRRKKFENMLTDGGLYAYPVRGKYNTTEHSYIVFNMPLNLAKEVAKAYDQQSFIFAIVKGENDVEFQYWEKNASEQDKDAKGKDKQYHYVESKEQFIKFDNDKDLFSLLRKSCTMFFFFSESRIHDVLKVKWNIHKYISCCRAKNANANCCCQCKYITGQILESFLHGLCKQG